jgi:hypothetical protein
MANQKKRWGGKLGGDHSTAIETAWRFIPEIIREKSITKISPGYIVAKNSPGGRQAVKIIDDNGCILLSIRGASAHQEMRVFTRDYPVAKLAIARAVRNAGIHLSFGNRV